MKELEHLSEEAKADIEACCKDELTPEVFELYFGDLEVEATDNPPA